MLNAIWLGIIFLSLIFGIIQGRLDQVSLAVVDSAKAGFTLALGLVGVMALWLGIMEIASRSGLMRGFSRILKPLMRPLFPDVPTEHPAMEAMTLNIAANMLGLANAATPFGLTAMKHLDKLNNHAKEASNAMCTFLAINTSSVQLIPTTAIAFLAANGSTHPNSVILSTLIATSCSTFIGILAIKKLEKLPIFRRKDLKND